MRLKLGVLVGMMTVLALAGGGSAAMASDGGGPTHTTSPDPGEAVAVIGIASDGLTQAEAEKFAKCVRANGIPDFETPKVTPPSGDEPGRLEARLPKDVDPETAGKATEKCLPGGAPAKSRVSKSDVKKLTQYAKCMRDNGIENFPTPGADGSLRLTDKIDPESDEFQAAEEACEKYAPQRRVKERVGGGPGEPILHAGRTAA